MKITYSMKEFHARVVEISNDKPDYVKVYAEYGVFGKWEFSCYIDSRKKIYKGSTPEAVLLEITNVFHPNEIDVEFPELINVENELTEEGTPI